MKNPAYHPIPLVFTVLLALTAPTLSLGQETATASDSVSDPAAAMLSVVERWQTDPSALFDAAEVDLAELAFIARPVVIFADSPNDPRFAEQIALLQSQALALSARKVILVIDSDPSARSALRLLLRPHGFSLVLIDTDGRVALRKPEPWDVRELTRIIDKMPSRLREIGR